VPSYFSNTHWAYEHMANVEQRMRNLGLLETKEAARFLPEERKRAAQFSQGYVEDDHIPFMERGVNILHIIPNPFPKVWHTMDDTGSNLDVPTIRDWAKIVTAFVAEWMDLDGLISEPKAKEEAAGRDEL
jgi:glutaminyl-peptide cyclotransferase